MDAGNLAGMEAVPKLDSVLTCAGWELQFGASGGLTSWSYYLRAFNLVPNGNDASEIGWGQWSKPGAPAGFNEVCGINPLGFACENGEEGQAGCAAYEGAENVDDQPGCEAACRWEAEAEADQQAGTDVCTKAIGLWFSYF